MNDSLPRISVVIPTRNRRSSAARTLAALAAQNCEPHLFDVILVADRCTDDTTDWAAARSWPFSLKILKTDAGSAGTARNRGAGVARAPVLLFLDDDVDAGADLIRAHSRFHETHQRTVAVGPYYPALEGRADFYRMLVRRWWEDQFHEMSSPHHRFHYRNLLSGNLSMRRSDFVEVGGFDERFSDCGGEDWELGIRLLQGGFRIAFLAEAEARHRDHEYTDLDRSLVRAFQEGKADELISRSHPTMLRVLDLARLGSPGLAPWKSIPFLAIALPALGDLLVGMMRRLLGPLEFLRFRRPWRSVYGAVRWYWYWRGVGVGIGGWRNLTRHIQQAPGTATADSPGLEVELTADLPAAARQIDRAGPAALRFLLSGSEIGRVAPRAGAEKLRGQHLPSLLGGDLRRELVQSIDLEMFEASRSHAASTGD